MNVNGVYMKRMSIYDEDFKNEGLHGKGYKRERGKKWDGKKQESVWV